MLIVLFSLLLLSVIGLGMMYSTNMETSINYNYRDKQIAFYAAMAGLQEARDRIQPVTHNIVAPDSVAIDRGSQHHLHRRERFHSETLEYDECLLRHGTLPGTGSQSGENRRCSMYDDRVGHLLVSGQR